MTLHPSLAKAAVIMAAALAIYGCAAMQATSGTVSREVAMQASDWHNIATRADRVRLRDWWQAWADALASAQGGGFGDDIAREGVLLQPQAALPNAALPPGEYRCRVIKLGTSGTGALSYVSYPQFACRVTAEGDVLSFVKLTGSQRHSGLIFPDDARRNVFLGTIALGDEPRAPDYGADAARNQAAWVERIGEARWRMVFPRPAFESIVDVMELVPAGQ